MTELVITALISANKDVAITVEIDGVSRTANLHWNEPFRIQLVLVDDELNEPVNITRTDLGELS